MIPAPLIPPSARGLRILLRTAEMHGMSVASLIQHNRARDLVQARFAAMLAMERSGIQVCTIARRMNRDHNTVRYGIRRAERLCEIEPGYADLVDEIADALPAIDGGEA